MLTVNIDISGVDQSKIMELYDGDMEIYLPVLRSYLSTIPAAMDKIRSVSAETLPEYTIRVHGIKSTSESIGAQEARKMAAELEALAKAGDLPSILAKNDALIKHMDDLIGNIQNWLARADSK
jgi:HPt (histidine-containing phosphotransfer) domain-containing protein